jgi:hypothetical protein
MRVGTGALPPGDGCADVDADADADAGLGAAGDIDGVMPGN